MSQWKEIAIAIALPEAIGLIGAFFTEDSITTWYKHLHKPFFSPPNWLFGPVWITLYALIGYASYLVWRDGGGFGRAASKIDSKVDLEVAYKVDSKVDSKADFKADSKTDSKALQAYGINLILNGLWTPIFFGAKQIGLGAIEILILWGSIIQCIQLFTPINKTAGRLLWPYLAWVTYAAALNISLWYLNCAQSSFMQE